MTNRDRQRRYEATPKGRASARVRADRYRDTAKGMVSRVRYNAKRRSTG